MRSEVKALVALLDTGAFPVIEGHTDDETALPYVVVIPARNADLQPRTTGPHSDEVLQFTVRCVGRDVNQATWLDEQVDSVLRPSGRGVHLQVDGRACSRLERRASDLFPDDSSARVWESVSSYRCVSRSV